MEVTISDVESRWRLNRNDINKATKKIISGLKRKLDLISDRLFLEHKYTKEVTPTKMSKKYTGWERNGVLKDNNKPKGHIKKQSRKRYLKRFAFPIEKL